LVEGLSSTIVSCDASTSNGVVLAVRPYLSFAVTVKCTIPVGASSGTIHFATQKLIGRILVVRAPAHRDVLRLCRRIQVHDELRFGLDVLAGLRIHGFDAPADRIAAA
jgi:hypothetical protein